MLKKITSIGIAAFILASGVASAKIINRTTEINGDIYGAAIHNTDPSIGWVDIGMPVAPVEGVPSVVKSANDLPVGHYDKIRYEHGPFTFKGYIEVTDDQPQYNGIYTTTGDYDSVHHGLKFKKTDDVGQAQATPLGITGTAYHQTAEDDAIGPDGEGVYSYQSGANRQIDEGAISLTISDVNGQHKADRTDISIVLDKSYLWFGNGWVDVEGDNRPIDVSFIGTTTTDASLTLGSHATNPKNAGDQLFWKENPDGSKFIYTDGSIDAPEIHFEHE